MKEQVGVEGEEYAPQAGGAIQQDRIGQVGGLIILSRERVHAAESKTKHDGTRNANVSVEPKGHYGWPRGRRRAGNAKGPVAVRHSQASRSA